MLVVETIARIRRDHLVRGVPIKKIARDLRVSKNTVRKVVRGDETSFSYARKIQPMPKLGPWVDACQGVTHADDAGRWGVGPLSLGSCNYHSYHHNGSDSILRP